jgi:small subunit ribosomal protein S15
MTLTSEEKTKLKEEFGEHPRDTGSSEVQVALLTTRIKKLTEHMKANRKDHHSRRSLIMLVSRRQRHLKYLQRTDPAGYQKVVDQLKLRR